MAKNNLVNEIYALRALCRCKIFYKFSLSNFFSIIFDNLLLSLSRSHHNTNTITHTHAHTHTHTHTLRSTFSQTSLFTASCENFNSILKINSFACHKNKCFLATFKGSGSASKPGQKAAAFFTYEYFFSFLKTRHLSSGIGNAILRYVYYPCSLMRLW